MFSRHVELAVSESGGGRTGREDSEQLRGAGDMSWPDIQFENHSSPSRNGVYKTKEFHGRGSRIVNMGELFGYSFISNQDMKRVELTFERELEANSLEDGDLLFGRRSLIESGAGKCSLVVDPLDSLTFESSIIRVRLNKKVVNPASCITTSCHHRDAGEFDPLCQERM